MPPDIIPAEPILAYRAVAMSAPAPTTYDPATRSVEVVIATAGVRQRRHRWTIPGFESEFDELLSFELDHMRTERVLAGACPLVDSHRREYGLGAGSPALEDVLGIVVRDTFRVEGDRLVARAQFNADGKGAVTAGRVQAGTQRNVSPGFRVYRYRDVTEPTDPVPVLLAIDWEMTELSFTGIPQDYVAGVRSHAPASARPQLDPPPESTMPDPTAPTPPPPPASRTQPPTAVPTGPSPAVPIEEGVRAAHPTPAQPPAPPRSVSLGDLDPANRERLTTEALAIETARTEGIRTALRSVALDAAGDFGRGLLEDRSVTAQVARDRIFEHLAVESERSSAHSATQHGTGEADVVRAGVRNALEHRCGVMERGTDGALAPVQLTEHGRSFASMPIMRMAEELLVRAHGVKRDELLGQGLRAQAASMLGLPGARAGGHTTSSLPSLLADVANKRLIGSYREAPRTFPLWATLRSDIPDFKQLNEVALSAAPNLVEVPEGGEVKLGTLTDRKEVWGLSTYGKRIAVTRQALVNDDLSALTRLGAMFGAAASRLEEDIVLALLTTNPVMADGNALFSAAHSNVTGTTVGLDVAGMQAVEQLLNEQTGMQGEYLDFTPGTLIVSTAQSVAMRQLTGDLQPATVGNVNPYIGSYFEQRIITPRFNAANGYDDKFVVVAGRGQGEGVVYGYLRGSSGPMIDQFVEAGIDGIQLQVLHDFGAGVVDWRVFARGHGS
jgi:hypothetical protein